MNLTTVDLAYPLAELLSERWGEPVEVRDATIVTAGARRLNAVFTASIGADERRLVLTLLPEGEELLNDLSAEAATIRAAEEAGVRVAHVELASDDVSLLGGPFMISSFVPGETVPRRVLRLVAERGHGDRVVEQLGASLDLARVEQRLPHAARPGLGLDAGAGRGDVEVHARRHPLPPQHPRGRGEVLAPRVHAGDQIRLVDRDPLPFELGEGRGHLHRVRAGDVGRDLGEIEHDVPGVGRVVVGRQGLGDRRLDDRPRLQPAHRRLRLGLSGRPRPLRARLLARLGAVAVGYLGGGLWRDHPDAGDRPAGAWAKRIK